MREKTVPTDTGEITALTDWVDEFLDEAGCPLKEKIRINVALDEVFSNIVKYAYDDGDGTAVVRLELEEDPKAVIITFSDSGKPYNPLDMPEPDVTRSAKQRKPGGLGIFLVKKTMDGLDYERRDGKNVLKIRKYI